MYHEFSHTGRKSWKYIYEGRELAEAAVGWCKKYAQAEADARKRMSDLMANMEISVESDEVHEAKSAVTSAASLHEECSVYAHEFARKPEKEFHLALGDVVFFGLNSKGE